MAPDETNTLRDWLGTYEPAVEVKITADRIVMHSTRHASQVACRRSQAGLASDLDATLASLVQEMS